MRVLSYIENNIWAILPTEYDKMHRIATRHGAEFDRLLMDAAKTSAVETSPNSDLIASPQSMTAKRGERLAGSRYTEVRDGVAVIDLNGVIAMRMNLFTELCEGGTSTEMLAKDFRLCLDSPNIHSIVFNVHSPGGEVFGTNEFAQMVFAARGKKPIKAYVSGYGCSAAYFIACAADEIIGDAQSMTGSIGVVAEWQDPTEFYKMLGVDRRVYTSSNAPKKRLDMNKPEDEAEFVAVLDAMEKVFHKFVAKARGVSIEQVRQDFGQGSVLIGADAKAAKMIDRVGSLEEVIAQLQRQAKKSNFSAVADGGQPKTILQGDEDMNLKQKLREFFGSEEMQSILQADEAPAASAGEQSVNTETTETAAVAAVNQPIEEREAFTPPATEQPKPAVTEQQFAQFKESAEIFATSEIQAGRMSPREKEEFIELFAQAAADDHLSPLASGTRTSRLQTQQKNRKSSLLTEETVNSETNQILLAQPSGADADQKKEKLLSSTQLGKRTLELKK